MKHLTEVELGELLAAKAERDRLRALIDAPEVDSFLRGVHIEAVHQVVRWGEAADRAKRPADWFWLVGYLAGKALNAAFPAYFELADAATARGEQPPIGPGPRQRYAALWDQLNGAGAWAANPWVWVVEFGRIET